MFLLESKTNKLKKSEQFEALEKEFLIVVKRVNKKELSKNVKTLYKYELDLLNTYNDIIIQVKSEFNTYNSQAQIQIQSIVLGFRDKLKLCFNLLKVNLILDENILSTAQADADRDLSFLDNPSDQESDHDSDVIETTTNVLTLPPTEQFFDASPTTPKTNNTNDIAQTFPKPIQETTINMAQEFLKVCSTYIRNNYSGDPLSVNSFVNSITLLKSMAGNDHGALLLQFILTKLEGKALELMPDNPTIDTIIETLKTKIKPDNSKVITGKINALRSDRMQMQDFAKQAEELADALKRSLVFEGITKDKANEMVVEETVKMCRNSAKSDLVKAVLEATTFTDPKDVVAKFITQSTTARQENQVLSYRRSYNNNYRSKRNHNGNRNFVNRQNFNNSNRNRFNYRYKNNQSRNYNNNYGNRGNSSQNRTQSNRSNNYRRGNNRRGDDARIGYTETQLNSSPPQTIDLRVQNRD